jgi:hypothetical protein
LNLKPWEFERLQPHEFISLMKGYSWRKEEQENMFAFFTAYIMNVQLSKPITAANLLEPIRGTQTDKRKSDIEYLQEKFKHVLTPGGE